MLANTFFAFHCNFVLLNLTAKKMENRNQKIALVTGGSRGLGKNMAFSLAKKGIHVVLTYHSKKEEAQAVVTEIEQLG
jgi:NAD(P)-dependent dehydrogenase (short-subunit alcohol dehydrogenase family)